MKKGLLIYDFDGVIVDSKIAVFIYYKALFQHFNLELPDLTNPDVKKKLFGMSHKQLLQEYAAMGSPLYNEMIAYVPPIADEIIAKTELESGAKEMIPILAQDYNLAICTNRGESVVKYLEKFGLHNEFSFIITSQDVAEPKPHPEGVFRILQHFATNDALFIGDSPADYMAAKGANVRFLAFKSELYDSKIIHDHREIVEHL